VPWYACTVNAVGPASDATDTPAPVIYINLTDRSGAFADTWFFAANGIQQQLLDVGIAAITDGKDVAVGANGPLPGNNPYTEVSRIYGLRQPPPPQPATLTAQVDHLPADPTKFGLLIQGNVFAANETVDVSVEWNVTGVLETAVEISPSPTADPDGSFQVWFTGVPIAGNVARLCPIPVPANEAQPAQYFNVSARGYASNKTANTAAGPFKCPRLN
jgi:hypothetical protein